MSEYSQAMPAQECKDGRKVKIQRFVNDSPFMNTCDLRVIAELGLRIYTNNLG